MVFGGTEAARQFRQRCLKRLGQSVEPLDARPRLRIPLPKTFLRQSNDLNIFPLGEPLGEPLKFGFDDAKAFICMH